MAFALLTCNIFRSYVALSFFRYLARNTLIACGARAGSIDAAEALLFSNFAGSAATSITLTNKQLSGTGCNCQRKPDDAQRVIIACLPSRSMCRTAWLQ